MSTLLSIRRTYEKHRRENPSSILSERAIRSAIKCGNLPSIAAGNKALICWETFNRWIKGEI